MNLFSNLNFKTYMYLDKTFSGIILGLKFIYGDIEIDNFSESKYENAEKVKNRQTSMERVIFKEIRNMGFEIRKSGFQKHKGLREF